MGFKRGGEPLTTHTHLRRPPGLDGVNWLAQGQTRGARVALSPVCVGVFVSGSLPSLSGLHRGHSHGTGLHRAPLLLLLHIASLWVLASTLLVRWLGGPHPPREYQYQTSFGERRGPDTLGLHSTSGVCDSLSLLVSLSLAALRGGTHTQALGGGVKHIARHSDPVAGLLSPV